MPSHFLKRAVTSVITLAMCTLPHTALADGLSGKDKVRIPTATSSLPPKGANIQIVPKVTDERIIIAMLLRRNQRAAIRRLRWFNADGTVKTATYVAKAPVLTREQIIRNGNRSLPKACKTLRTNERSACLRSAGVERMNRMHGASNR